MAMVKQKSLSFRRRDRSGRTSFGLETLEDRRLMAAAPWGHWPTFLGMDKVFEQYPWLNGSDFNVAVIDKGIDYYHPALAAIRRRA